MSDSFYITTPIYYVNDRPHIGHAYTTILADVLARYHRLLGDEVFFLTGTDEHGQKVQQAAEKRSISPQAHADETVHRFTELWEKLEVTHNDFIRTTEDRHTEVVQEILQDLYDRGEIYRAEYDGWYDVTSETFVTEKEVEEGGPLEQQPNIIRIQESNYFFRMSKHQEWLIQYIEDHPEFIQPDFRRNETLGFLRKPLTDLCISRPKSRLNWGIELPFDSEFVTYVWFDALVNYISAPGYLRRSEPFDAWWPASIHLIGKDILTTHTVYWPTMLKAMGLPLPEMIFAHGWWLSGAAKMSKSAGNVVNPMDMIDRYGVDPFRYFLISEMTLGQDAAFTEALFVKRFNSDLANDLGNLLNRATNMVCSYCDAKVPTPPDDLYQDGEELELWNQCMAAVDAMETGVRTMKPNQGLQAVLEAVRATNRFFELRQPWTLGKQGETQLLERTLYAGLEALRITSALLKPVMPGCMQELCNRIGMTEPETRLDDLRRPAALTAGLPVTKGRPLFPRIDPVKETSEPPGKKSMNETPDKEPLKEEDGLITFDDFSKVDLRTARILEAEKIEGADRLLKISAMMGSEKRQIVAGIAQHYDPEDLAGKTVVLVANLKPAKIRGIESEGMLLAASKGESLRLVTVEGDLSSGAKIR